MENMKPVVSAKRIVKVYDGVTVLKGVDLDIFPGEVHALIGENGAGKSTLVKVISGVTPATDGEVFLDGKKVVFRSPHAAREAGIALIHQEPLTFPDLNVTENIYIGHTRGGKKATINWNEKYKQTKEILEMLDLKMDPRQLVRDMTIADQQMLEIAAALSQNARVIIMDEPTAALSQGEVENLFRVIRKLVSQGKALVYIGHRLNEIMEITDRVTVLRDGEQTGDCMTKEVTENDLVNMMVGREMSELIVKEKVPIGEVLLETKGLTYPGKYYDVSITVRRGEIVGIAGLVGAGRSEVGQAVFGLVPALSGQIFLNGKEVSIKKVKDAMDLGIAMVPEDRARTGLILPMTIRKNMSFADLSHLTNRGFMDTKKEDELVKEYIEYLSIKLSSPDKAVKELSGGNQQKVVLAKWLMTTPDLLILDEPTRGIDVGAKAEVYTLISELAKQGKAILMISSEMNEILQLSDRAYVMCEGHVTAELAREDLSDVAIMTAASSKREKGGVAV